MSGTTAVAHFLSIVANPINLVVFASGSAESFSLLVLTNLSMNNKCEAILVLVYHLDCYRETRLKDSTYICKYCNSYFIASHAVASKTNFAERLNAQSNLSGYATYITINLIPIEA